MVDGEDWWARYCLAGMNEWDYPVDSRKLLNKLFKDDYRKFSKRISLRSMEEMIRRTTHNFVWMPREFHDAAKMDVGFPPVIDGSRNRIRELTKYLSFVEDLDLTTCEGRNIYLPYSSDCLYLARGEMFHFLLSELDYWRLRGVNQLAYLGLYHSIREGLMLNDPNPKDALAHTRFQHCTLAAAMIETVMTRGSFGDEEIGEATLATFMHDYATPGLGDTMKTLDRKGLDEETHFLDSLSPERQELLLKRLKIDIRRVDGIINGAINTPATSLLHSNGIDIDKISYVAIDCFNFLQMCQDNKELPEWNGPWRDREDGLAVLPGNIGVRSRDDQFGLWQQYNHWRPPALKHHLESILQKDPDLFEIHKDIEVHRENGSGEFKAVFSNPRRALAFIRMRAYLCSMLYCSDESRGKEAGYFHHLFGRLYGRGLLKAEHLRRMTDREAAFTLLATLAELEGVPVGYGIKKNGDIRPYVSYSDDTYVVHYGHDRGLMDYFIPLIIGSRPYIIKRFDNHQELYKETPPSVLNNHGTMIKRFKGFKTGIETLVKTKEGIVPLYTTLKAKHLQELDRLRASASGVYLFQPNPEYREIFKRIEGLHRKAAQNPRGEEYPLSPEFIHAHGLDNTSSEATSAAENDPILDII